MCSNSVAPATRAPAKTGAAFNEPCNHSVEYPAMMQRASNFDTNVLWSRGVACKYASRERQNSIRRTGYE
jgi:hypothetical protein